MGSQGEGKKRDPTCQKGAGSGKKAEGEWSHLTLMKERRTLHEMFNPNNRTSDTNGGSLFNLDPKGVLANARDGSPQKKTQTEYVPKV